MKKANPFSSVRNKKILITGGTGFIGSWLTEMLYQHNSVTVFDNGRRNALQYIPEQTRTHVELVSGDIRNENDVSSIVQQKDIIFHLAAIAGASSYEKDPLLTLEVNLLGTERLLRNIVNTSVSHVILFSSSEVYGPDAHDVSETDSTVIGPLSEGRWSYAISKLASDHLAWAYRTKHAIPATIVRPFNVYGPRQVGEGAIGSMIQTSLTEQRIYVTGDGSQKRAWCYITDFLDCLSRIVEQHKTGTWYNIGNPHAYVSMNDVAAEIAKLSGNVPIYHRNGQTSEIYDRLPNIDRAESELGFHPNVSLSEGLSCTYAWYKAHTT